MIALRLWAEVQGVCGLRPRCSRIKWRQIITRAEPRNSQVSARKPYHSTGIWEWPPLCSILLMSGLCDPSALVQGDLAAGGGGGNRRWRSPPWLHHVLPEPRHLTFTFIRSVRCPPANTKQADRPPPLPSNCPGLTRRKCFMHPARWGSYCSPVRSDRLRHDQRANPSFTKVITVLARRQSKSSRSTVLFVGVSDAGKTAILSSVSRQIATIYPIGCNQTQTSFESYGTASIPRAATYTCLITDELESNNATERETTHPSPGCSRTSTYQGPISGPLQ